MLPSPKVNLKIKNKFKMKARRVGTPPKAYTKPIFGEMKRGNARTDKYVTQIEKRELFEGKLEPKIFCILS